jgi:peptidoglycan-associated lipoprotein
MLQKFLVVVLAIVFTTACPGPHHNRYKQDGYSDVMPAQQSELEAKIGDRVLFEYNSSVLTMEAKESLAKQAEWLKVNPAIVVTIEGHADERGTREYNIALGERRAQAVKNYIVSHGINSDRVFVVSFGKEKPAMLGSGESVWSQNRRAVTVVSERTQ